MGITDGRGTGAGWTMTLKISQLTEYNTATSTYVAGGKTLPLNSIIMDSNMGVGEADITSSPAGNLTVIASDGTNLNTGDEVPLLAAIEGEGMGSYDAFWDVILTIPANAYVGTYKANATTALNIVP
jgi:hypothetical protein